MEPKEGLLTFMAEGSNLPGSQYYSRRLHWPGNSAQCNKFGSGVTIGRGYDLKHRSRSETVSDLTFSGVPPDKAKKIAEGSGKSHCAASDFVKLNRDVIGEIAESQQLRLLRKHITPVQMTLYGFIINIKSGFRFLGEFNPPLKDVLVDMKYQGRLRINMIPAFGKNEKKASQTLSGTVRIYPTMSAQAKDPLLREAHEMTTKIMLALNLIFSLSVYASEDIISFNNETPESCYHQQMSPAVQNCMIYLADIKKQQYEKAFNALLKRAENVKDEFHNYHDFVRSVTNAKLYWDKQLKEACLARAYLDEKESFAFYTDKNACLIKGYAERIDFYNKYSF